MRTLGTLIRHVDEVKELMREKPHPVLSFEVVLDDPMKFNPYCWDAAEQAGHFWEQDMPTKDSFFYLTDEYEEYLTDLIGAGEEHPANTNALPWMTMYVEPIDTTVVTPALLPSTA